MTFRDSFGALPGVDEASAHPHDGGDVSGEMPFVRKVGGVHVPDLAEQALRADHSGEIAALTEKSAPVDADVLVVEDSEAFNAKKKLLLGTLAERGPRGVLGYTEVTSGQSLITAETDLTGLSVTVDVGADRMIKITGWVTVSATSTADPTASLRIKEATTQLQVAHHRPDSGTASRQEFMVAEAIETPSSGSHTYKLTLERSVGGGSLTTHAGGTQPAFILVEDIGAAP